MSRKIKATTAKPYGDPIILDQPTGTFYMHNNIVTFACNICGDDLDKRSVKGRCWKCWRSLNPGALMSP